MKVYNKVKWILGILLVFFLITATNLIDKDNFRRVRDSVVTIYEDRLVAKDLVFELSLLIQEKEMANALADAAFFDNRNKQVNTKIEEIIDQYLTTKLIPEEERTFKELQNNLSQLKNLEANGLANKSAIEKQIPKVKENLYSLSKIQLEEGNRQLLISKEVFKSVELFTRIEIYLLIVLAIAIQILIIYQPKD